MSRGCDNCPINYDVYYLGGAGLPIASVVRTVTARGQIAGFETPVRLPIPMTLLAQQLCDSFAGNELFATQAPAAQTVTRRLACEPFAALGVE